MTQRLTLAAALFGLLVIDVHGARADWVGAAAGAGTGLVVAGPLGAVAGGVVGGVFGRPFWGPPVSRGACWIDDHFHRHCHAHW